MPTCAQCGRVNEPDARFCSACGAPLEPDETQPAARKIVTVLFCDVTGSTAMGEKLDPEASRRVMARYFETAREVLERHGGTVEKFIGDAVMAVFGIPRVHEDDALRAVRAADQLRAGVTELELRMGVNTGEVVTGTGETLVTGDAVNVAARLEQAARPGEVLIGASTYRLVRDGVDVEPIEALTLKGKRDAVDAFRLLGVREDPHAFTRRLDAPLVGRRDELASLGHSYTRAVADESCQLFTVLGPPGIGKSRLAQEFITRAGDEATVLSGRCLPYGDGITYWPLVEILRELGGESDVAARLAGDPQALQIVNDVFTGVGLAEGATRPEEINRAVRRLFEALARGRPLVVVLDDLQWAEPTFLDLVEHISVLSRDAPIFLLGIARPELLDDRPGWSVGENAARLALEPLTDDEAEALMTNLIERRLDKDVRARIASSAGGNPLFVEQMLAMLSEDGDGEASVPPTIQALLASRLDKLDAAERALLERAAIVGKEFWHRAVADLGADTSTLPALVRKEFIRPHSSSVFENDDAYRFRHDLILDAVYAEIPKERRAQLHEQVAAWLEGNLSEHHEIVGYHLEQACRFRSEVGLADETTSDLAERAGRLLGAAGLRAADRADIAATINLLNRARSLLERNDSQRLELLIHLGYAYMDAGELKQALAVFTEAHEHGVEAAHAGVVSRANVGRLVFGWNSGQSMAEVLAGIEQEIETLQRLGDAIGLAEAYREAGKAESHFGRTEKADALFEQAVVNARLSGSRRVESDVLVWRLAMQCWGYLPAGEGVRIASGLLEQGASGMGRAFALVVRGRYRALQGDLTGGRADMAAGRALIREFGADYYVAGSGQENAMLELEAGDPVAAEAPAREAYEMYVRISPGTAGGASFLARALVEQGRFDEGERFARLVADKAAPDDTLVQSEWRSTRAVALARKGDIDAAYALAREAVALVGQSDYLEFYAQALVVLADVLALRGKRDEARDALERAVRVYERKESVVGVARASARLRELDGEPLAERN